MLFSSILAVAKSKSSFYLSAVWYSIMQMYHSFGIHSFSEGHLGCFQHLAIVSNAVMNIGVQRFFSISVSGFLRYNSSSGILRSKGSFIFRFSEEIPYYFPQRLHQVCIPTNSEPGSCFLHNFASTFFVDLFMMSILTSVKWSLIVVLISISLMANDAEHTFICL